MKPSDRSIPSQLVYPDAHQSLATMHSPNAEPPPPSSSSLPNPSHRPIITGYAPPSTRPGEPISKNDGQASEIVYLFAIDMGI
ncbi:hypothetical protein CH063_07691 [Colletotrichum higginsianum]|uniref:Uncharacterized protein n=1 Tax=Colletotrichum higginsianum (strain IMI 349063) TaxID=759273 RepID=H1V734_COLHI|nr:hypothetical protein CH063_07691 [Colletotrichum higginsianum]